MLLRVVKCVKGGVDSSEVSVRGVRVAWGGVMKKQLGQKMDPQPENLHRNGENSRVGDRITRHPYIER